ncbi:MAG: nitroreductase family protein [Muribaculaceae bacterium]|nr:nitroreductase family protein [Muribaculaceae bacterium]
MSLDFFNSRATVRNFSSARRVSDATLDALLESATHAPSTGNMQLYSVIVTRDELRKSELTALHLGQPAAKKADAMLTFCADVSRFGQWCAQGEAESGLDNMGGKITAIIDAVIFAQQFVTAAEMTGIGCCYLGTVMYNLKGYSEFLGLPQGVIPLFTVAVGYPADDNESRPSDRLPLDAIVSREKYHTPTAEEISRYYAEKEALEESRRFVIENNKKTLAQVYAEIRYPKDLNEKIGADILAMLK